MSGFVLERKLVKCAIGRVVGVLRVGGKLFRKLLSYPDKKVKTEIAATRLDPGSRNDSQKHGSPIRYYVRSRMTIKNARFLAEFTRLWRARNDNAEILKPTYAIGYRRARQFRMTIKRFL